MPRRALLDEYSRKPQLDQATVARLVTAGNRRGRPIGERWVDGFTWSSLGTPAGLPGRPRTQRASDESPLVKPVCQR